MRVYIYIYICVCVCGFVCVCVDMKELRTLSSRLKHIESISTSGKAGSESEGLSQSDYVTKLRELNEEIATSWIENNRVGALKLAIRVASLLMDSSVPMFYNTLFVLVSDLMDTMGQLVWERIRNKHEYDESGRQVRRLGKVFTCHDVREEAKDVCGNWFYKIGSVSDLIPRLYMEAAIIRCSYYLHDGPPVQSLQRMAGMIGGIGNPLARIHAACFIARRACQLIPANYAATDDDHGGASSSALPDLLMRLFLSTLPLYRRVTDQRNPRQMHFLRGLELDQYCELFTPALRWLAHCVVCCGHDSGPALAADFVTGNMDRNVYNPDDGVIGAFVSVMLDELPDAIVSARADVILKTIVSASFAEFGNRDGAKRATCLRVLAAKLLRVPATSPKRRRAALVGAWRLLRSFTELEDFMSAADVWIEYAAHHLTMVELDACFADVAMRFEAASNDDDISARAHASLDSAIFKVLDHDAYTDVAVLLESETFVRVVDCLGPDGKQMLFRRLLGSLQKKKARVRDMLTLNFYLDGAKAVAATVDRLTAEGTRKEVFRTIVDLIQSIDFGRDFETHLSVLVECRKSFPFIEPVQEALVLQAIRLAVLTMKAFKGKTTERSSAFIRSCLAFCQITIPSLQGVVTRLNLFTISAGAALQNGLVGLAEGLLKSAIVLLSETESTSAAARAAAGSSSSTAMGQMTCADESGVVLAITNMCGLFVVLPGHPEYGALYIIEKLVAAVDRYTWACEYDSKLRSCVAILCLLASLSQERLPYRIRAIDSNDVLYSSEPEYQDEIAALAKKVFATAVGCALGDDAKLAATKGRPDEKRTLAHTILSLVSTMASMYTLGQDELLAVEQIYGLAQQLLPSDDRVVRMTRRVVTKYLTSKKIIK